MIAEIKWLDEPEEHDFPAAFSYLSLVMLPQVAERRVSKMRLGDVEQFKAKDIVRAAGLPMLGTENRHVDKNFNKIHAGKALSPVLLVRGNPLIIADGYHRTCAVYLYNEDAWVRAVII